MKYTIEETKARELHRQFKRNLRTVHHHFALLSSTCCKCGREFQFELGYRIRYDYAIAVFLYDICNECVNSREEACNKFYNKKEQDVEE